MRLALRDGEDSEGRVFQIRESRVFQRLSGGQEGAVCRHPGFVRKESPGEREKFLEVVCGETLVHGSDL